MSEKSLVSSTHRVIYVKGTTRLHPFKKPRKRNKGLSRSVVDLLIGITSILCIAFLFNSAGEKEEYTNLKALGISVLILIILFRMKSRLRSK